MKKIVDKYFIPGDHNDHQPHFLRKKSVLFFIVGAVLFELVTLTFFTPLFSEKFENLSAVFPAVLFEKVNDERVDFGENVLSSNDKLILAAQMKANDMAEKGYFSHVSPDGKDPWYWVNLSGYQYLNAGENLAVNFIDSNDVHNAWMNSPTHRQNILRGDFAEMGIATAEGLYKGRKAIFVAQFFGEPSLELEPIIQQVDAIDDDVVDLTLSYEDKSQLNENESLVLGVETSTFSNSENVELSLIEKIKTSPKSLITFVLYIFGIVVMLAILLKVLIKIKIQHPKLILNGIILLIILFGFIYFNEVIVNVFSEIV